MGTATGLDPGRVDVRIEVGGGRARVGVACTRPSVTRILNGQPAAQAVALVPLLFSLCGRAQGVAAQLALDAARGGEVAPHHDAAVAREVAGEHLWRLLLDWPRRVGLPAEESLFVEARRRLAGDDFAAWAGQRLRLPFDNLLAALANLPEPAAADDGPLLPPLLARETVGCWPRLDEAFAAAPTWNGAPAETGALARQPGLRRGRPILDRVRARVEEVLSLSPGQVSAAPVTAGIGRGAVDTARGLLLHEIALDGERIARYTIVAPTEWNFHARGVLSVWLAAARQDQIEGLAARAVLALDPCVPWQVAFHDAGASGG